MSSSLPPKVLALVTNYHAWIVGSAADPDCISPRDYDVLVPYSEWGKASHLIPKDAVKNSFGGWKFKDNDIEVDVWPGEMGFVMQYVGLEYVWQPHIGLRFRKY